MKVCHVLMHSQDFIEMRHFVYLSMITLNMSCLPKRSFPLCDVYFRRNKCYQHLYWDYHLQCH